MKRQLPWPVLFAMYRAACAPRIYVRPGSEMTITLRGEVELHAALSDGPTIVVESEPDGSNPGKLTIHVLDDDRGERFRGVG